MNDGSMAEHRWVGCCVVLALSCGRTANQDRNPASAGSPPAVEAAAGSGGATGGGASVPGHAGEAGAHDCPITPVAGQWFARGPDPYGFDFTSDGSRLSGVGCLGALPSDGEPSCTPLVLQADRGRSVDFSWNANSLVGGYAVKMQLTLSPERTAMAGTVWTSLGSADEGQDIVLVRYPVHPVPPATACSGGEPSGECFLRPLRSDRVVDLRVVELGNGNLLLLWKNQRGLGDRLGSARFDAAAGAWQEAEFLDDGAAPVESPVVAASPEGWAMVAYRQADALLTRAYDPAQNVWSEQQVLVVSNDPSARPHPETLFVYDGGEATLIASTQDPAGLRDVSAHDFVDGRWQPSHLFDASIEAASYQLAAAFDQAKNALVLWVRGGPVGQPHELWFSNRKAAGTWSDSQRLYATNGKQILRPAAAVGKDGVAIATWQELMGGIVSSSYSVQTLSWSEPLVVTSEPDAENRTVAFNETGGAVAYFHRSGALGDDAEQKSELANGSWGAPQTIPANEIAGQRYSITLAEYDLQVTPLFPRAGESAPVAFSRPRCEGY